MKFINLPNEKKPCIIGCSHLPVGSYHGSYSKLQPSQIGAASVISCLADTIENTANVQIKKSLVSAYFGTVLPNGQGQHPSKMVLHECGLSTIPSAQVNRVCNSGLVAIFSSAMRIASGEALQESDETKKLTSITAYENYINGFLTNNKEENKEEERKKNIIKKHFLNQNEKSTQSFPIYLSGGYESMTFSFSLNEFMAKDALTDTVSKKTMGLIAAEIFEKFKISREQLDAISIDSYLRALNDCTSKTKQFDYISICKNCGGLFLSHRTRKNELEYIQFSTKILQKENCSHEIKEPLLMVHEELLRIQKKIAKFKNINLNNQKEINKEILNDKNLTEYISQLPGCFGDNNLITAASSSKVSDGAACIALTSKENILNLKDKKGIAEILAITSFSTRNEEYILAPLGAVHGILSELEISVEEISSWQINEAFAGLIEIFEDFILSDSVPHSIEIPHITKEKIKKSINSCGGAVAIGHPLGASGVRIVIELIEILKPNEIGIAVACNGGGGASVIAIKRLF